LEDATYEVIEQESLSDPNRIVSRKPFKGLLSFEF
jgi:hypothetical protein